MQKQSRKSRIAIASSILLPYGIVITGSVGMTTNQFWLFPLWNYLSGFGNMFVFGVIIPPFLPSFPLLPPILGLIWLAIGLYISRLLYQFHSDQREANSVRVLTISVFLLQIVGTIIIAFIAWAGWINLVIPLPLQPLIVLFLLQSENQGISRDKESLEQ